MPNPTTPQPVQEPAGAVEALRALVENEGLEAFAYLDKGIGTATASGKRWLAAHHALASLQPVTQAKSEAVAWRPGVKCIPPQNFNAGKPKQADIDYWKSIGVEIEYAYAAPQEAVERQPLTGWQPIETAPKDGTTLYLHKAGKVSEGSWLDIPFIEYRDAEGCFIDQQDSDAYWMDHESGDMLDPTEWMPKVLPEPPGIGPATQEKQHG